MILVTAAQMQAMDRRTIESFGIPGRVLMENAGRGATRCFLQQLYSRGPGRVGVLAGRGNNGGDGFVIARYLAQRGVDVTVFLLSEKLRVQGDAEANLALLEPLAVPVIEMPDPETFAQHQGRMRHMVYWIDALLGTGLADDVKGYFRQVLEFVADLQRPVLAVDVPSGLNADTGRPCGICLQADVTVTFGCPKIGQLIYPGAVLCGRLELIDIGIPPMISRDVNPVVELVSGEEVARLLPRRSPDAHKGQTGHTLVVAGSKGKTGAAAMTAMSAMRMGAGLVTLAVGHSLNAVLEPMVVEVMTLPLPDKNDEVVMPDAVDLILQNAQGKQTIALGPGLGGGEAAARMVAALVEGSGLPMVIDADGLNHLVDRTDLLKHRSAPTIITPHPGEMARLCEVSTTVIQQDRIGWARRLAGQLGIIVVLKGARTVVAEPDGRVWLNPTGNSGMAGGGMGDVLTGAVAGLLAQGCGPAEAARAAVYCHGLAADILAEEAPRGYLATEIMDMLPTAVERVMHRPPALPVQQPVL